MSRLLVVGIGPYPTESKVSVSGPTIRLRQFVEPLCDAGHDVHVMMLESRARHGVQIKRIARAAALTPADILEPWKVLRELQTPPIDAIFGVGSMMPVAAAARLAVHLKKPLWADFFGDPLAEFHGGASRQGVKFDTVLRDHIWKFVREALNAADCFSTVSGRQSDAVLGQLVLTGRATEDPAAHRRVYTIPCGIPEAWTRDQFDPPFPETLVEQGLKPETPFIFVGGNWTPWLDEELMGRILSRVLAIETNCNLVIRGGADNPLADQVRRSFFAALGENAPADRVHELAADECGEAELLAYASATLLLDRDIPESYLGSRNRLLSFIRWGLRPVVSTHSELARELTDAGLALAPAEHETTAYISLLRHCLHTRADQVLETQQRGIEFLRDFTFAKTLEPVLEWAEHPDKWGHVKENGGLIERWRSFGF